jgi:hypothetical protein
VIPPSPDKRPDHKGKKKGRLRGPLLSYGAHAALSDDWRNRAGSQLFPESAASAASGIVCFFMPGMFCAA